MSMRGRKKAVDRGLRAHVAAFMWPGYSVKDYLRTRVFTKRWLSRLKNRSG